MRTDMACEQYQVQLSALLDDEIEPHEMRAVLDHVLGCPDCARFYREARGLQLIVERIEPAAAERSASAPARVTAATRDRARERAAGWLRPRPAWGWAAAVVVAAAAGLWGGSHWLEAPTPALRAGSEQVGGESWSEAAEETRAAIEIPGDGTSMNEERFVELTVELLRADRRYQQEMSAVLKQVDRIYTEDAKGAL